MAGNVGVDVVTTSTEKRPYAATLSWGQHSEPANPRAAQDADEHSFSPVVGVVAGRYPSGSHTNGGILQCVPTRVASASLEIPSLGDDHAGSSERYVERTRKILGDVELSSALKSKSMVYTVGEKAESAAAPKASEDVQKGD